MHRYQKSLIEASENFNPQEIEPATTLEVPEHLTAVIPLPVAIRKELARFAQSLYEQESSLLLVNPDNYHITLAAAPLKTGSEQFSKQIEDALQGRQIELDLSVVFLDPAVIAVAAFPKGQELYETRQQILNGLGEAIEQEPRTELGWVSLARFTRHPSVAMVDVALQSVQREWGQIQVDTISIYSTANKHLDGATEVTTIHANLPHSEE